MERDVRYQGAIVRDDRLLLIRNRRLADGRTYWLFPGGGIEASETPEECVRREVQEETGLDVRVVRLILDLAEPARASSYRRLKTYLCEPKSGKAKPGSEPEHEVARAYSIIEVKWFDLRDESGWDPEMLADDITYPQVRQLRQALGYLPEG